MSRKSIVQLVVLILLFAGAAWLMRDKIALLSPRLAEKLAGNNVSPVVSPTPPGPLKPVTLPDELSLRESDMPPLSAKTKPLQEAQKLPALRAPIVYLAYVQGPEDVQTTCASAFERILRFHMRAALPDRLVFNIIPANYMRGPYVRQDGSGKPTDQPVDKYIADAIMLDCDTLVSCRVTETTGSLIPAVDLLVNDLKSTSSRTWNSSSLTPLPATFPDLMRATIKTAAKFAGASEDDIVKSGMLVGIPKDETWKFLLSWPKDDDEIGYPAAMEADPDCRVLYEFAWSWTWQKHHLYVDGGLKKWPDDARLLRRKVHLLSESEKPNAAFVYLSEVIRRYPECFLFSHELPDILDKVVSTKSDATTPPKYWQASIEHLRNQAARFPRNWYAQWDTAYGLNNYGRLLRGGKTVDKIPRESLIAYSRAYDESVEYIDKAADLRPDCSDLLRAQLYMNYTAGNTDRDWQTEIIERIHRIDPSNYKAETLSAFSHSVGWGRESDFWYFINMALKNHPNDKWAINAIAMELGTELSRRMNFKAMEPVDVYKNPNELNNKFIECAEYAMNNGVQVEKWVAGMLREMYRQRYGEQKVQELYDSGKHWALTGGAATDAFKANDFERSLRLARMSLPIAPGRDDKSLQQQNIVKALWKLKRYDEALTEARSGISKYPEKPTFHYLFAVVATEKGGMDQEAYDAAYRAVDINSKTDAINAAFERIRAKLNKPQHPKLKS